MKKCVLYGMILLSQVIMAQTTIPISITSAYLDTVRKVEITLPESYDTSQVNYPVIYCLDGDYTQFMVNGLIQFNAYLGKSPECIVVSIPQNYLNEKKQKFQRWIDCGYSWKTGMLKESGMQFKDFIQKELIPEIEKNFRVAPYKAIIGHSFTANYVNYFLLDERPFFNAYVAISPYYASNMYDSLQTKLDQLKEPVYYFTAYGENDLSGHKSSVQEFDKRFGKLEIPHFHYELFDLNGNKATHYTIFTKALPFGFEHIFPGYGEMTDQEVKEVLHTADKVAYLRHRIAESNRRYGTHKTITESDVWNVGYAIEKKKQWSQFKELGEWFIQENPEQVTGYYALAGYYEKTKDFQMALKYYQKGYSFLGEDILNKADFQEDIYRMQKKLK